MKNLKEYNSGLNRTYFAAIMVALIVGSSLIIVAFWTSQGPTNPNTTNPPAGGYGPLAAQYINSKRDNAVFMWSCNNSFVNVELTNYYKSYDEGAYVDGLYMIRNDTGCYVKLLFAPYFANLTGYGQITNDDWDSISGALVDDGIGQMTDAQSHPQHPDYSDLDFFIEIYFDDLTFFYIGSFATSNLVFILNGTWTGHFLEWGWPEVSEYDFENGKWLTENGLLDAPKTLMYNVITSTITHPP